DDTIDIIPLSFLSVFFGKGGKPVVNFANMCNQWTGQFAGTNLANCSFMASDIQKCQAKGKIVTISLGGSDGQVGFSSPAEAAGFAKTVWDMFLEGSLRPFGTAILDGVDLNIETGSPAYYTNFVNALRALSDNSGKRYYVTAAPQCPFPDQKIGYALNHAFFDAVYVQFYNNYCQISAPNVSINQSLRSTDNWAKTQSLNKAVKVYLGAAAARGVAGHLSSQALITVARDTQKKYSSFGGVMLWDADTAYSKIIVSPSIYF
ncbi:glycoside hydrolase family 18 protein, partial [Hebeloma cylindrosporum]